MTKSLLVAIGLLAPICGRAEVAGVEITTRAPVLDGQPFGATGAYEKLIGKVEFALDPADPHNKAIVDLEYADPAADGRVHFFADLYVLRPVDPAKGNGVLLFELPNRGFKAILNRFNRGRAVDNPSTSADFGDGLLMREGYTIVWLGWEFDVPAERLRLDAPRARLPSDLAVEPLAVDIVVNERVTESLLVDEALRPPAPYPPAEPRSTADVLTVRDRFWDAGAPIARERWQFATAANGLPVVRLDGGFDPGRWYRVTYRPTNPVVAGVALAAIRDAASAFRYRTDLPIRGTSAYAFGQSQTGRLLREFLYEGFNVDERDRRVFDGLWIHIAGAARGTFNDRFATPASGDQYRPTQFPFADSEETDIDGTRGGLQSLYAADKRPKIFYTNTPVEYWGGGRAAALTHTSVDGKRDLTLPDNVRMYLLAGTQHLVAPFPPGRRCRQTPRATSAPPPAAAVSN